MSMIFVNTDNTNSKDKLYEGTLVGATEAAKAESKIEGVVKDVLAKTPGFTTTKAKDSIGYSIYIRVAKVTDEGSKVLCGLSGWVERYPAKATAKKGDGKEMVGLKMTGNGYATSKRMVVDVVEAITEELIRKQCVPLMRLDMPKRS